MSYSAPIDRAHPALLIFLIDQSRSMGQRIAIGEEHRSKAQGVCDALNRMLFDLILRCTKEEGVLDYFHVAVIGYGYPVRSLLFEPTVFKATRISHIAAKPMRVDERRALDREGRAVFVRLPVWVDPQAYGWTAMCEALDHAAAIVNDWVAAYPGGFPPVLFNLTDGGATDGDPRVPAGRILRQTTADGSPLVFNIHLSSRFATVIRFPPSAVVLPEKHAVRLFEASSVLPPFVLKCLAADGDTVSPGARGLVYNSDLTTLVSVFDIGTRALTSR